MILFDATTRKLQVVLAGAKTTNDCPWVVSYVDIAQSGFAMQNASAATGTTNGITAVDMIAAPGSGNTRQAKYINIFNADTAAVTVTVQYNDNSTIRKLVTVTIPIGYALIFNAETGWSLSPFYQAGQIPGTTTNDNAAAGNVGEFISSVVTAAAPINAAASNNAFDITSINLTAGDWDVYGNIGFSPAGSTVVSLSRGWINTQSVTAPGRPGTGAFFQDTPFTGIEVLSPVGTTRISIAGNTTVYLSAVATYSVSTLQAYGFIGARRAR